MLLEERFEQRHGVPLIGGSGLGGQLTAAGQVADDGGWLGLRLGVPQ